jgi:hypothetical protein
MSTITVSTGIAPTGTIAPATRLRLTVRGRRVLATLAALPAIIAIGWAVLGGGSALASLDDGGSTQTFTTVTVAAGDTLWSIAQEVAPQADPRDVVDAITRLNAIDGATLQAGARIAIPAEYDSTR